MRHAAAPLHPPCSPPPAAVAPSPLGAPCCPDAAGEKGTEGSLEYLVYSNVLVQLAALVGLRPVLDYGDAELAALFEKVRVGQGWQRILQLSRVGAAGSSCAAYIETNGFLAADSTPIPAG